MGKTTINDSFAPAKKTVAVVVKENGKVLTRNEINNPTEEGDNNE